MDGLSRRARLARSRLYFVTDVVPDELLAAALRGGVDVVQLRAKELADDELVAAAERFRRVCEEHGALFILNDRPDLVERTGADGAHVGQDDLPVEEARRIVGSDRLVGLSTHSREQLEASGDADYVGVGTLFATPTKPDNDTTGLDLVRTARHVARVPWFAIGGIDTSNVADVARAGANGVAVVRAIRDAADPEAAARTLRAALPPSRAVVGTEDVLLPQLDWLRSSGGRATSHVHAEHTDVFHVLRGTMEFRAGDGTVRLPAGSTLAAPPRLVHGFRLPDGDAAYLNVHAPGGWARDGGDTLGVEHGDAAVRPVVSAPGDGDRLTAPHRLAVVKVDLPDLTVVETFVDAEFEGPEPHVHLHHADCFHVLEGALAFELEDGRIVAEAGTSVVVPPGVPHGFTGASPRVRYLNVHAPGAGFVDHLRDPTAPYDQHPLE